MVARILRSGLGLILCVFVAAVVVDAIGIAVCRLVGISMEEP